MYHLLIELSGQLGEHSAVDAVGAISRVVVVVQIAELLQLQNRLALQIGVDTLNVCRQSAMRLRNTHTICNER
jgi:hypothetical protein